MYEHDEGGDGGEEEEEEEEEEEDFVIHVGESNFEHMSRMMMPMPAAGGGDPPGWDEMKANMMLAPLKRELFEAARDGQTEHLFFMHHLKEVVTAVDERNRRTPLHWAAYGGHLSMVKS